MPPDIAHYREWSARVWELVREMSPGRRAARAWTRATWSCPTRTRARPPTPSGSAVAERVRLSCSLGVATCKVVAKVASDRDKPGGVTVVAPGRGGRLPGAAAAAGAARHRPAHRGAPARGRARPPSATLAALDDEALRAISPGAHGEDLRRRARGIDPRRVEPVPAERISISSERTFAQDVRDRPSWSAIGRGMAGRRWPSRCASAAGRPAR